MIRRKRKHGAEVPTHSLNDIMFFLLLFFLIISTLTNPNVIKILTARSGSEARTDIKKTYELQVTAQKEYFYNKQQVSLEELENRMTADGRNDENMLLAVDIEADADIQELVDILSLCKKANVKYYLKDPRTAEIN